MKQLAEQTAALSLNGRPVQAATDPAPGVLPPQTHAQDGHPVQPNNTVITAHTTELQLYDDTPVTAQGTAIAGRQQTLTQAPSDRVHPEQGGPDHGTAFLQHQQQQQLQQQQEQQRNLSNVQGEGQAGDGEESDEDESSLISVVEPAMWTRGDIVEFKECIRQEGGASIIKVGHGETVTVRVPTHDDGHSIFWEFATDHYDIGEFVVRPNMAAGKGAVQIILIIIKISFQVLACSSSGQKLRAVPCPCTSAIRKMNLAKRKRNSRAAMTSKQLNRSVF